MGVSSTCSYCGGPMPADAVTVRHDREIADVRRVVARLVDRLNGGEAA